MIPLSVEEIAHLVGGVVHEPVGGGVGAASQVLVTGPASIDSRAVAVGGLFVAFAGERVDGHDYAPQAVAAGAAAVLGTRPTDGLTIVVPDVQQALQDLAAQVLSRLRPHLRVIALTGSAGKTTVKDMLAAVLSGVDDTVATQGSFNNEIGLPLTVLGADHDTRFLVLEMGARGIGHLRELAQIAPPDIALVLNVGTAHVGEFGSQDKIAQAKGEIVDALGPSGTAILNADDPRVAAMASRSRGRVVTFGSSAADVLVDEVRLDDLGRASFALTHDGQSVRVQLQLLGEHQVLNAAAVAAVALTCQLPLSAIGHALGAVESLSRWRMELSQRGDGLIVINDAYNANPESMGVAVATLRTIAKRTGRRTVAVLGEMLELGADSTELHRALGASTEGISEVVSVGTGGLAIHRGRTACAEQHAHHVESVHDAIEWLRHNVGGDDVVLIKASRSIGLEAIAAALLDEDTNQTGAPQG